MPVRAEAPQRGCFQLSNPLAADAVLSAQVGQAGRRPAVQGGDRRIAEARPAQEVAEAVDVLILVDPGEEAVDVVEVGGEVNGHGTSPDGLPGCWAWERDV